MAKGKYLEWLTDEGLLMLGGWSRDGLTDEQVAVDLHYSFLWVCVLHGQALEKIKECIEVHTPPVV